MNVYMDLGQSRTNETLGTNTVFDILGIDKNVYNYTNLLVYAINYCEEFQEVFLSEICNVSSKNYSSIKAIARTFITDTDTVMRGILIICTDTVRPCKVIFVENILQDIEETGIINGYNQTEKIGILEWFYGRGELYEFGSTKFEEKPHVVVLAWSKNFNETSYPRKTYKDLLECLDPMAPFEISYLGALLESLRAVLEQYYE